MSGQRLVVTAIDGPSPAMADFFGFIRVDLEQALSRWHAHRRFQP